MSLFYTFAVARLSPAAFDFKEQKNKTYQFNQ
jgi:hypothetical protein